MNVAPSQNGLNSGQNGLNPQSTSLPSWVIPVAAITVFGAAGAGVAYAVSSKSPKTAPSSLGHDSIATPGEAQTSSDLQYSQAQINARQEQPKQPTRPARAEGQLADPERKRHDLRDDKPTVQADQERLRSIGERIKKRSADSRSDGPAKDLSDSDESVGISNDDSIDETRNRIPARLPKWGEDLSESEPEPRRIGIVNVPARPPEPDKPIAYRFGDPEFMGGVFDREREEHDGGRAANRRFGGRQNRRDDIDFAPEDFAMANPGGEAWHREPEAAPRYNIIYGNEQRRNRFDDPAPRWPGRPADPYAPLANRPIMNRARNGERALGENDDLPEDVMAHLADPDAAGHDLPAYHPEVRAQREELELIERINRRREENNRRRAADDGNGVHLMDLIARERVRFANAEPLRFIPNEWGNQQENPPPVRFQPRPARVNQHGQDNAIRNRHRNDRREVARIFGGFVHSKKNINGIIKIHKDLVEFLKERGLFDANYSPEIAESTMNEIKPHIATWAENEREILGRLPYEKTGYKYNKFLNDINTQEEKARNSLQWLVDKEPLLAHLMREEFPNMHPRHVLIDLWKFLKAVDTENNEQAPANDKDPTLLLSQTIDHLVKALNDADASGRSWNGDRICGSGQIEQLTQVHYTALGKHQVTAKSAKLYADTLYTKPEHNDDLYRIMDAKDREALARFIVEKSEEEDDNEEINVENPEGKLLTREVVDEYLDELLPPNDAAKRNGVWEAMKFQFDEPAHFVR